jgi:hypothetical protein
MLQHQIGSCIIPDLVSHMALHTRSLKCSRNPLPARARRQILSLVLPTRAK